MKLQKSFMNFRNDLDEGLLILDYFYEFAQFKYTTFLFA